MNYLFKMSVFMVFLIAFTFLMANISGCEFNALVDYNTQVSE